MPENEKAFTQISLSFDPDHQIEATPVLPVVNEEVEQPPINVGIRIKAFKEAIQPVIPASPQPPVKVKSTRGRKSLKTVEAEAELVSLPEDEVLFSRQYYSIGEVAEMFRVNTSLIRFWENEFDILKPRKNRKGDRLFRPEDVKNLQIIYYLLRNRKFSLEGAKKYLRNNRHQADVNIQLAQSLTKFRSFLLELKANLGA